MLYVNKDVFDKVARRSTSSTFVSTTSTETTEFYVGKHLIAKRLITFDHAGNQNLESFQVSAGYIN